MHTSGTTGSPKPVFVPVASVLPNLFDIARELEICAGVHLLLSSPLTFDPSMIDVLTTLLTGATLVVVPRCDKLRSDLYQEVFEDNQVNVLQCTPSLLRSIFANIDGVPQSLRKCAVGGEKCCARTKKILRTLLDTGRIDVYHLYGLTEMSVWQSMLKVKELINLPTHFFVQLRFRLILVKLFCNLLKLKIREVVTSNA